MQVKESVAKGYLPQSLDDLIGHDGKCESCGEPLEIDSGLNDVRCKNRQCEKVLNVRLGAFLKFIGIESEESDRQKYIKEYGIKQLLEVIEGIEDRSDSLSVGIRDRLGHLKCVGDCIRALHIPYLVGIEERLSEGYHDVEDFYYDVYTGGLAYIIGKLDYKYEAEVLSGRIYKGLIAYEKEIKGVCKKCIKPNQKVIRLVVEGISVSESLEVLREIKEKYKAVDFIVSKVLNLKTDVVISIEDEGLKGYQVDYINGAEREDKPIKIYRSFELFFKNIADFL